MYFTTLKIWIWRPQPFLQSREFDSQPRLLALVFFFHWAFSPLKWGFSSLVMLKGLFWPFTHHLRAYFRFMADDGAEGTVCYHRSSSSLNRNTLLDSQLLIRRGFFCKFFVSPWPILQQKKAKVMNHRARIRHSIQLEVGRTFPRVTRGGWRVTGGGWRVKNIYEIKYYNSL